MKNNTNNNATINTAAVQATEAPKPRRSRRKAAEAVATSTQVQAPAATPKAPEAPAAPVPTPEATPEAPAATPAVSTKVETDPTVVEILDALLEAHRQNNMRCINMETVPGLPEQALKQWSLRCEDLRKIVQEVSRALNSASAELRKGAEDEIFPAWKSLCESISRNKLPKHWFCREGDAKLLVGYLTMKHVKTAKGSALGDYSQAEFRRRVETLVGCRLSGAQTLTAGQTEIIERYEGARRTVKTKTQVLNGYMRGDIPVVGLIQQLEKAKAKLELAQVQAQGFGLEGDALKDYLSVYTEKVDTLQGQVSDARKALKTAKEYIEENRSRYDAVMAEVPEV